MSETRRRLVWLKRSEQEWSRYAGGQNMWGPAILSVIALTVKVRWEARKTGNREPLQDVQQENDITKHVFKKTGFSEVHGMVLSERIQLTVYYTNPSKWWFIHPIIKCQRGVGRIQIVVVTEGSTKGKWLHMTLERKKPRTQGQIIYKEMREVWNSILSRFMAHLLIRLVFCA